MPEQALYLKWRPQVFEDVVGQDHITRTLRNSIKTGRVRHAYLFSGPRGTGKTTMARLLAKAVNCQNENVELHPCGACPACVAIGEGRYLDLIEIDAATHTGVDDVRDLRDKIAFAPGAGHYKVYIIDEVHRFTGNAFDALLKTLEEPPDHAIFVLATTEIDKVPDTIKSRCLQFEFRRVALHEVADRLQLIAETEGLVIERSALELIARQGTGSVRDSVSLLDQIVTDPAEQITLELVQRILGTTNYRAVGELVDALIDHDVSRGLHIINEAVDSGNDPRQLGQQVVEHLRAVLLAQTASADLVEAAQEERDLFAQQAENISRTALLRAIRSFNEAVNNYTGGWQPQLALELAFIESLAEPEVLYMPAFGDQPAGQPMTQTQAVPMPVTPLSEPGSPPVVPPAQIHQKWVDAQRMIAPHNKTLAATMDYARLLTVDGNRVIMGVEKPIHLEKLKERTDWIERALLRLHQVQLHVQFVLNQAADIFDPQRDIDMEDPLLKEGFELGGHVPDTASDEIEDAGDDED